jgi:hypothetical protein
MLLRSADMKTVPPRTPVKTCGKCKLPKPLSDFRRWSRNSDGYAANCKPCKNSPLSPEKAMADRAKAYGNYARYQDHYAAYALMRNHGLTPEEWEAIYRGQAGLAHDRCNRIVGQAGDCPDLLRVIADNLEISGGTRRRRPPRRR